MKLFYQLNRFKKFINVVNILAVLLILQSCATSKPQFGKALEIRRETKDISPDHTFFLVGDAGNADEEQSKKVLEILKSKLDSASENSTLLFLGDNVYPNGLPDTLSQDRKIAEAKLDMQIDLSKNFKGKTIFIPGNHDYYSNGVSGLKNQEDYVNKKIGVKKSFLPKNGCGIDDLNINDNLAMIIIDSQWYLEDWDNNPTINENCSIKSREDFFTEIEDLINKFQDKTIIIAIHHPLMSNGTHGGQFSLEKQLFPLESKIPLPVIGSLINYLRKNSGISPQDIHNKKYSKLVNRIKTLIQSKENIIVVSGHDHNLQYIEKNNIKQIISGSASKTESARAVNPNDFSYGGNGFAVLQVQNSGAAKVQFFGLENNSEHFLHEYVILEGENKYAMPDFDTIIKTHITSQIYDDNMVKKSGFYDFLWGKKYRNYYNKPVEVPVADLTTLCGGFKPLKEGGGHQSKSLRLEDSQKRQFVMRALKKSAVRFIQTVAFKNQFVENDFKNTYAEGFLLDFYTSSHPYTPFIVGELADPIGINHTNPKLFYVPKQSILGGFNQNFGDELYMIEERPSSGFTDLESFGKPDDIISTDDVLKNLIKDEKYKIDERAYIRARIFDMLIGDWDRHSDQWRWAVHNIEGNVIYRPIPRDRDQAFTIYQGSLLSLLMRMPALRHMQSFDKNIRNVKWFNMEPYPMDIAFLKTASTEDWIEEAQFIANHLTRQKIDQAFEKLPVEFHDDKMEKIKELLEIRKTRLKDFAKEYSEVLKKTALVVGTNKKDKIIAERISKNQTKISVIRMKKNGEELQYEKLFDRKHTKEIWIYGLQDEDLFVVKGKGKNPILLRILGGSDTDNYQIENHSKVKIYDFASEKNIFKIENKKKLILRDNYELNTYDYKKPKYNFIAGFPSVGYNPDDGIKLGFSTTYTVNGFKRNPFSQKHNIKVNYYFATSGYELLYKGIFPNIISKWFFQVESGLTSSNFSSNFFGYGNETKNLDDDLGMNYNRVRTKKIDIKPSLNWLGDSGGFFSVTTKFDAIKVDETFNRIMSEEGIVNKDIFNTQLYGEISAKYGYTNMDFPALPTLGFHFSIEGGTQFNLEKTHLQVPVITSELGFVNQLDKKGKIVFSTNFKTKMLFSNDFQFYQMATLGGDLDLRGFRNERFYGKQSFYQGTDLRFELGKLQNAVIPVKYGIITGFDYGRVWLTHEDSNKWHNSYGGGIWLSGVDVVTAKISYFNSADGGRITFGFSLGI